MKIKSTLLAAACAAFLNATSVHAALNFTIEQVGPDVVLSGSGTANLTDLTLSDSDVDVAGGVAPSFGLFLSGSGLGDRYSTITAVPFGSGAGIPATTNTGLPLGIILTEGPPVTLVVPAGYVSGDPIAISTSVFENTTLEDLGITPDTYIWTWGTGPNADSATMNAVPEPSTAAMLFAVAVLGLAPWRRRKR